MHRSQNRRAGGGEDHQEQEAIPSASSCGGQHPAEAAGMGKSAKTAFERIADRCKDPENKHSMINFTQSFYFRGHLCISTELLGMNLYEFIKAHDFRGFSLKLIRRFTKQLLSSLVLLHSHKVIHCDLKPEN